MTGVKFDLFNTVYDPNDKTKNMIGVEGWFWNRRGLVLHPEKRYPKWERVVGHPLNPGGLDPASVCAILNRMITNDLKLTAAEKDRGLKNLNAFKVRVLDVRNKKWWPRLYDLICWIFGRRVSVDQAIKTLEGIKAS